MSSEFSSPIVPIPSEPLQVGTRVRRGLGGDAGTVRFLGQMTDGEVFDATAAAGAKLTPGVFAGVEWDAAVGKNDGTYGGRRYFRTARGAGYGSLVQPRQLVTGVRLCDAMEQRYASVDEATDAGGPRRYHAFGGNLGERDPRTGAFTRVTSCDCTANDAMMMVARCGPRLGALFPHLRDLSLARTLVHSWATVRAVAAHLPQLQRLDVSWNPALGAPSMFDWSGPASPFIDTPVDGANFPQPTPGVLPAGVRVPADVPVLSRTVTELRVSHLKCLRPACVPLLLLLFPAATQVFIADNAITWTPEDESADGGLLPRLRAALDERQQATEGAQEAPRRLEYLNLERNPLRQLEDVRRLVGVRLCETLRSLNLGNSALRDGAEAPVASERPARGLFPCLHTLLLAQVPIPTWFALGRVLLEALGPEGASVRRPRAAELAAAAAAAAAGEPVKPQPAMLTEFYISSPEGWTGADVAAPEQYGESRDDGPSVSFLPEDARDRRKLLMALLPPAIDKLNRSEVQARDRAAGLRGAYFFADLVRSAAAAEQQGLDPEQHAAASITAAPVASPASSSAAVNLAEDPVALRLLDTSFPPHLQAAVVEVWVEQYEAALNGTTASTIGLDGGTAVKGAVAAFHAAAVTARAELLRRPRRLITQFDILVLPVFPEDAEQAETLLREHFVSLLDRAAATCPFGGDVAQLEAELEFDRMEAEARLAIEAAATAAPTATADSPSRAQVAAHVAAHVGKCQRLRLNIGPEGEEPVEAWRLRVDPTWEVHHLQDAVLRNVEVLASDKQQRVEPTPSAAAPTRAAMMDAWADSEFYNVLSKYTTEELAVSPVPNGTAAAASTAGAEAAVVVTPTGFLPLPAPTATQVKRSVRLYHIDREMTLNPGAVAIGAHVHRLSRMTGALHRWKFVPCDFVVAMFDH